MLEEWDEEPGSVNFFNVLLGRLDLWTWQLRGYSPREAVLNPKSSAPPPSPGNDYSKQLGAGKPDF